MLIVHRKKRSSPLGVLIMKLTKKSEYAFLALIDLAENAGGALARIDEIAARKEIPRKYLEQILLQLKSAGFVKSIRGASGGYKLAKQPAEITLAAIVRLIDGPLAPVDAVSKYFYGPSPIEKAPKLVRIFQEIRDEIAMKMERTTIADII